MTASQVASLSDAQLIEQAWTLTTNIRACGGASKKGLALARRRLRRLGVRYFLGGWSDSEESSAGTCWGMIVPGQPDTTAGLEWVVTGVTPGHAAHKLGGGSAKAGWKRYWGQGVAA